MVCGFKYRELGLRTHMAAALQIHAKAGKDID